MLVDYFSRGAGRTVTTLVVVIGISCGLGDYCPSTSSPEEPGVLDDGTMLVHKGLIGFVSQVEGVGLMVGAFVPDLEGLLKSIVSEGNHLWWLLGVRQVLIFMNDTGDPGQYRFGGDVWQLQDLRYFIVIFHGRQRPLLI